MTHFWFPGAFVALWADALPPAPYLAMGAAVMVVVALVLVAILALIVRLVVRRMRR